MQWTIEGADGRMDEERVIQIEAPTREEAEQRALREELLVSSVSEAMVRDPAEELERIFGPQPSAP